ncbi:DNA recombination protein RmuC, partial [Candidatus Bipolaricaulota bacterium]
YLDAMQLEGARRTAKLDEHVRAMRSRIQDLSRKQYWAQFERAPELVVMFVPFESALSAAFERDPELLEYGIRQHILVASPVTLLALLRAVAFGWQQHQITENAEAIASEGRQLHDRVVTFLSHLTSHGKNLDKSVETYNQAIASLQTRLMPSLRRFKELGGESKDLPEPEPIDTQPRLPLDPDAQS